MRRVQARTELRIHRGHSTVQALKVTLQRFHRFVPSQNPAIDGRNTRLRRLAFGLVICLLALGLSSCTTQRVIYYTWSFNGSRIQADMFLVKEDGTGFVALANSPDDEYPCGITSDKRVVFTRMSQDAHGSIYVINADGTGLQTLQSTGENNLCFGVSGDDQVIFTRSAYFGPNQRRDIYSVNADGSNQTNPNLLASTYADEFPLAITSNNRVVYARQDRAAIQDKPGYSIFSIPAAGGVATPIIGSLEGRTFAGVTPKGTILLSYIPNHELSTIHDDGTNAVAIAAQLTNPATSTYFQAPFAGIRSTTVCAISGERFLFDFQGVYQAGDSFTDTYVVNADGTGLTLVHHPSRGMQDSCRGFAYTTAVIQRSTPLPPYSCSTPCTNLLTVPLTGGAETPLAMPGHSYTFQTAAYNYVIFSEFVGKLSTLYAVKNDGTGLLVLDQFGVKQKVTGTTQTRLIFEHDTGIVESTDLNAVPIDGSKPTMSLANPGNFGTAF